VREAGRFDILHKFRKEHAYQTHESATTVKLKSEPIILEAHQEPSLRPFSPTTPIWIHREYQVLHL
jgi:hypothetical protein